MKPIHPIVRMRVVSARWTHRLGTALVLLATLTASACDGPTARPSLRICSDPTCIDTTPIDVSNMCDALDGIEPGQGFYAVHAVPSEVALHDSAKGALVIETGCGSKSHELHYESALGDATEQLAVLPILAPNDVRCGMTIRATLLDQSNVCVRKIDGPADECAALRDACSESSQGDNTGSDDGGAATAVEVTSGGSIATDAGGADATGEGDASGSATTGATGPGATTGR